MVITSHAYRRPLKPSLVAHLLKVAGAIFPFTIARGRHRSGGPSFVLCGVPSASFVRGSHEQDSLLPAGAQRLPHQRRLAVSRVVEHFPAGANRLDALIDACSTGAAAWCCPRAPRCPAATKVSISAFPIRRSFLKPQASTFRLPH